MGTGCHFPQCERSVLSGLEFCQIHFQQIKTQNLCHKCLKPKDVPTRYCRQCWNQLRMAVTQNSGSVLAPIPVIRTVDVTKSSQIHAERRLSAVKAGLCSRYWCCARPAQQKGCMCEECFKEYISRKNVPHQLRTTHPRPSRPASLVGSFGSPVLLRGESGVLSPTLVIDLRHASTPLLTSSWADDDVELDYDVPMDIIWPPFPPCLGETSPLPPPPPNM